MLTFCVSLRGNCSKKMMSIFWRESLKDSFVLCVCVCVFLCLLSRSRVLNFQSVFPQCLVGFGVDGLLPQNLY